MYQLRNLSEIEKESVLLGPVMVSLLIGGADGEMTGKEMERISELIHVKTYSLKNDVEELYLELEKKDVNSIVNGIVADMPEDWEARREVITAKLQTLSKSLKKMEKAFATQYLDSLKSIAVSIANAAGGVFGIGTISESESEVLDLPMIERP